jgi:hypothetical protein
MYSGLFVVFALLFSADDAGRVAGNLSAANSTNAPALANPAANTLHGNPSLNSCAFAMQGTAWNTCDSDADGYVYEDGKYKPPVYNLARGKQRQDIPAGMRRIVIFCRHGEHPVNTTTGAFLDTPGPRLRCDKDLQR